MADYSLAIPKVLKLEGLYQNDPNDPGNYNAYDSYGNFIPPGERKARALRAGTMRGISAAFLSGHLKRQVSAEEIKGLTEESASGIYKAWFWDAIKGDEIRDQLIAEMAFDARVHHGPTGTRLLQRTLNKAFGEKLEEDGVVGPLTLGAINRAKPPALLREFAKIREAFYHKLVKDNPALGKFLDGWLNRLRSWLSEVPYSAPPIGLALGIGVGILILALIESRDE